MMEESAWVTGITKKAKAKTSTKVKKAKKGKAGVQAVTQKLLKEELKTKSALRKSIALKRAAHRRRLELTGAVIAKKIIHIGTYFVRHTMQDIKKVMQSKALGHMIKISKRLPARNKHLAKVLMPLLKASVRSALAKADKIVRTRRMRNKKKKRAMADAAVDPWDKSAKGKAALSKKKARGKAKKKKAGKKKKVGAKKTKKKKTKKTGAKRTASSKKVVKKKEEEEEEVLMQKISIKSFIARQLKAAKTVLPQANRAVQAKKNSLQNLLKAVKKEEKKVAKKKVTKKKKVSKTTPKKKTKKKAAKKKSKKKKAAKKKSAKTQVKKKSNKKKA